MLRTVLEMAAVDDDREPCRPRYELGYPVLGVRADNALFKLRNNGNLFYINMSPRDFINPPATTKTYLSYLEVLRSGEEVMGDVFDTDVYE